MYKTHAHTIIIEALMFSNSILGAQPIYSYSSGGGPMVLNNLQCRGDEASLLNCPVGLLLRCGSAEIAGVGCTQRSGTHISGTIMYFHAYGLFN